AAAALLGPEGERLDRPIRAPAAIARDPADGGNPRDVRGLREEHVKPTAWRRLELDQTRALRHPEAHPGTVLPGRLDHLRPRLEPAGVVEDVLGPDAVALDEVDEPA